MEHFLRATFYFEQNKEKSGEKGREKSREKSGEKILNFMLKQPKITIAELMTELNLTHSAIEKNIQKLKQQGKITRIGADKGGYWKVN